MSYKTRARKRQIRRHQKQSRAANGRIDRLLRGSTEPPAVGLMPTPDDPSRTTRSAPVGSASDIRLGSRSRRRCWSRR